MGARVFAGSGPCRVGTGEDKTSESVGEVLTFSPLPHARARLGPRVLKRRNSEDLQGGIPVFIGFLEGGEPLRRAVVRYGDRQKQ